MKGSGATAGFTQLAGFAHQVEEIFDLARENKLTVTPDLLDNTLKAVDFLRCCIDDSHTNLSARESELTLALKRFIPESANRSDSSTSKNNQPTIAAGSSAFQIRL